MLGLNNTFKFGGEAMMKMVMNVETITPEIAESYLSKNIKNRKLSKSWTKTISSRITRGEWILSHQGIAFDQNGKLCDGQHRLSAIIESGRAIDVAVFRNVPNEAFGVLDQGKKRTMADLSGMQKRITDPVNLAARITYGSSFSYEQFTTVLDSSIGETVLELVEFCGTTAKLFSSAAVKLAVATTVAEVPAVKNYAFELYRALVILDFERMPPIAHSFVRQVHSRKIPGSGGSVQTLELLTRALVCFDPMKQQVTRLQVDEKQVSETAKRVRYIVYNAVKNA